MNTTTTNPMSSPTTGKPSARNNNPSGGNRDTSSQVGKLSNRLAAAASTSSPTSNSKSNTNSRTKEFLNLNPLSHHLPAPSDPVYITTGPTSADPSPLRTLTYVPPYEEDPVGLKPANSNEKEESKNETQTREVLTREIMTPIQARLLQSAESLKPPSDRDLGSGSYVARAMSAAAKNVRAGLVHPNANYIAAASTTTSSSSTNTTAAKVDEDETLSAMAPQMQGKSGQGKKNDEDMCRNEGGQTPKMKIDEKRSVSDGVLKEGQGKTVIGIKSAKIWDGKDY